MRPSHSATGLLCRPVERSISHSKGSSKPVHPGAPGISTRQQGWSQQTGGERRPASACISRPLTAGMARSRVPFDGQSLFSDLSGRKIDLAPWTVNDDDLSMEVVIASSSHVNASGTLPSNGGLSTKANRAQMSMDHAGVALLAKREQADAFDSIPTGVEQDATGAATRREHESQKALLLSQIEDQQTEIATLKDTLASVSRDLLKNEHNALIARVRAAPPASADGVRSRREAKEEVQILRSKLQELQRELEVECARSKDLGAACAAANEERDRLAKQLKESTAQLAASEQKRQALLKKMACLKNSTSILKSVAEARSELSHLQRTVLTESTGMRSDILNVISALKDMQRSGAARGRVPSPNTVQSIEKQVMQRIYERIVQSGLTHRHAVLLLGLHQTHNEGDTAATSLQPIQISVPVAMRK